MALVAGGVGGVGDRQADDQDGARALADPLEDGDGPFGRRPFQLGGEFGEGVPRYRGGAQSPVGGQYPPSLGAADPGHIDGERVHRGLVLRRAEPGGDGVDMVAELFDDRVLALLEHPRARLPEGQRAGGEGAYHRDQGEGDDEPDPQPADPGEDPREGPGNPAEDRGAVAGLGHAALNRYPKPRTVRM